MTRSTDTSQPRRWADEFDNRSTLYGRLREEVDYALRAEIGARNIKVHTITSRVKERSSFIEKITRKGYADPFREMPDIVGARAVCLFLDGLSELREVVRTLFVIVEEENKIDGGAVESFGYMSYHYICTLKPDHSGPRYHDLHDLRFEIQCRTLLMDAWANVSHYLAYKGNASIPEALRRDFHALGGLFYVADRHFQLFFGASTESDRAAEQQVSRQYGGEIPLNRATVRALLRKRFPDRDKATISDISEFVEEVTATGRYRSIGDLKEAIDDAYAAFLRYEHDNPPDPSEPGDARFADLGAARLTLAIFDRDYAVSTYGSYGEFEPYRPSDASD